MKQEGYSFGGEQSGHIIIPQHATTGDGQLTAVALLSLIKRSGKKLSELAEVMKKYPQHTVNIEATQNQKIALFTDEEIKAIISDAEAKLFGDGRLVVRASGTEPVVRIMVESKEVDKTKKIAEDTAKKIKKTLSNY